MLCWYTYLVILYLYLILPQPAHPCVFYSELFPILQLQASLELLLLLLVVVDGSAVGVRMKWMNPKSNRMVESYSDFYKLILSLYEHELNASDMEFVGSV